MKVKISIEQEWDLNDDSIFYNDDPFFDENKESYDHDNRVDILLNRFAEDIDFMVKYDEVRDNLRVEYFDE